ncbi:MAG: phosphoglycerate dehydrogenase [Opitutaceae bacterium]|nr:phosphoglycerate dehydrogenase [Opitutaceae bacterium]
MLPSSAAPSTPTAPQGPNGQRVLFALGRQEKEAFFPLEPKSTRDDVAFIFIHPPDKDGPRENWAKTLREIAPTVLVSCWQTPSLPAGLWREQAFPLKYVCHLAGSVGALVPRELLTDGLLVSNWGATIQHTVAEHALLLTLAALRNLPYWRTHDQAAHYWWRKKDLQTRTLRGRRVGLHGFGAVARELRELLRPFGCVVSAPSAGVPAQVYLEHDVTGFGTLEELFSNCEILVECEALTPTSRGSVNESLLRQLPIGAVFVNVGRGAVVDEAALALVARQRNLRVASDVVTAEPFSAECPLWALDDALISPHIAGPTFDLYPQLGALALTNIERYFKGLPIPERVTLEAHDRATKDA